jgi:hypothetical protein
VVRLLEFEVAACAVMASDIQIQPSEGARERGSEWRELEIYDLDGSFGSDSDHRNRGRISDNPTQPNPTVSFL